MIAIIPAKLANLVIVITGLAAISLTYLAVSHLLRISEVTEAMGMVRRKLAR